MEAQPANINQGGPTVDQILNDAANTKQEGQPRKPKT